MLPINTTELGIGIGPCGRIANFIALAYRPGSSRRLTGRTVSTLSIVNCYSSTPRGHVKC